MRFDFSVTDTASYPSFALVPYDYKLYGELPGTTECGRTSEGRGCLPPLPLGIHALSVAFDSVIAAWQSALPGAWFPISIVVLIVALALLFKRLF